MKKYVIPVVCALALFVLLAGSAGLVTAGDSGPANEIESPSQLEGDVQNYIPVQGKLTDAGGTPLNGEYEVAFRLYDVYTGGTALCLDTNIVKVANGLFSSEIWGNCQEQMNGQQLYLSIEVEGNGEMDPRQPIFAVPYAWSLRPNAKIIGSVGPEAILHIENADPSGRGLRSYATSATGTNFGVVGGAVSPNGFGGYFYNTGGGTGLRGESNTGAAIKATGSGVIQSSANSYVWVSGNGLRPYLQSNGTIIDMDTVGGAKVTRGPNPGDKNVMLPITITAPLYGQNVTITGLDIYYLSASEFDGITYTLMRRQTGMCSGASCYVNLVADATDLNCDDSVTPTGCSHHWNVTTNNILTANSGIIYLTFQLTFSGATGWVDIGGVRLTLAHE